MYVDETSKRMLDQVKDRNARGTSSDIFKNYLAADHQFVCLL